MNLLWQKSYCIGQMLIVANVQYWTNNVGHNFKHLHWQILHQLYQLKKEEYWCWDSNPGPLEDRRRLLQPPNLEYLIDDDEIRWLKITLKILIGDVSCRFLNRYLAKGSCYRRLISAKKYLLRQNKASPTPTTTPPPTGNKMFRHFGFNWFGTFSIEWNLDN